ncbi:MAG: hypothetical protein MJ180_00240 [Candidatus Gastranaerophilales bacterium]|nr:hypothetical protein [Candidatus Gastranaerophilales bacterium]
MKNFIVKFGSIFVDIMAIVTIVGLIISTITMISAQGIWAGLGVLWAGLISFILVFYVIYLLMAINEKLSDKYNSCNR